MGNGAARRRGKIVVAAAIAAATVPLVTASSTFAAVRTWDGGGTSNSYFDAGNWVNNTLPNGPFGPYDDIVFGTGFGSGSIDLEQFAAPVQTLTIDTPTSFSLGGEFGEIDVYGGSVRRLPGSNGVHSLGTHFILYTDTVFDIEGAGHVSVGTLQENHNALVSVTKLGSGELRLAGLASPLFTPIVYSGGTYVGAGTLTVAAPQVLGADFVDISENATLAFDYAAAPTSSDQRFFVSGPGAGGNGAIRVVSGAHTLSGAVRLTGTTAVAVGGGASLTLSGTVDAIQPSALTKFGEGILRLSGETTFSEGLQVLEGTAQLDGQASGGPGEINILNGATLRWSGESPVLAGQEIRVVGAGVAGGGAIQADGVVDRTLLRRVAMQGDTTIGVGGGSLTIAGGIDGNASLRKVGPGTLVMQSPAGWSGDTHVAAGTLSVTGEEHLTESTRVTEGATLHVTGNRPVNRRLTLSGTGANSDGALRIGQTSLQWTGLVTLENHGSVGGPVGSQLTVSGAITGPFSLSKVGGGILGLTNPNNQFNQITVIDGTLRVTRADALPPVIRMRPDGTTPRLELDQEKELRIDAEIDLIGNGNGSADDGALNVTRGTDHDWRGRVTIEKDASVAVASGAELTVSGRVRGGNLSKVGPGTLVLSGQNQHESTVVRRGVLEITTARALPEAHPVTTFGGGTLALRDGVAGTGPIRLGGGGARGLGSLHALSGGSQWSGPITLGPGATIGAGLATLDVGGVIDDELPDDPSPLVKVGVGILRLRGVNAYRGGTVVHDGDLEINGDAALGERSGPVTVNGAGRLIAIADAATGRTFTLNAGGSIDARPGVTLTYDGATVNGGFLRGAGKHAVGGAGGEIGFSRFNGVTVLGAANLELSAPTLITNSTNGGKVTTNATSNWDGGFITPGGELVVNNQIFLGHVENLGHIDVAGYVSNFTGDLVSGGGGRITVRPQGLVQLNGGAMKLHGSLLVNDGEVANGVIDVGFGSLATGTGTFPQVNLHPGGTFTPGVAFGLKPNTASDLATIVTGGGDQTVDAPIALLADTVAAIPSDRLRITMPMAAAGVNITKVSAGSLEVKHIRAKALAVEGGTVVVTPDGTAAGASVVDELSIIPAATLDLTNNDLLLHATAATRSQRLRDVEGYVASARNAAAGRWRGAGLTSSAAAGNALTALAIGLAGDDVVVKYTYNGDANLDGQINSDDYFRIDSGFLAQPSSPLYAQGDFNYDDRINSDDYFLIDSAFLGQGAPLVAGDGVVALASVTVPEPSIAVAALTWAATATLRRRHARV